jgi:large subunit ribosomal protein L4
MAMSARLQEGNLIVINDFVLDSIKTKKFVDIMKGFDFENCLLITDENNENVFKSARNVNGFKVLHVDGLNVYDILLHKKLMLVKPAIESLEKRLTP